jgi:hypothetical protein
MLSVATTDDKGNTYKSEKIYTVNDMGKLMNNVTSNIMDASISEMRDAGLISSDKITKTVPYLRVEENGIIVYYMREVDYCTIDGLINSIPLMVDSDFACAMIGAPLYSNYRLDETYKETKTGESPVEQTATAGDN